MMLGDSLEQLARMLDATQPGFVRCIKPNTLLQPMLLQGATCMEQLRCMGVLQLIDARKKGFSSRYPHAEFVERYKPLAPNLAGGGASAIEPFVAKLRSQYTVRGYVRACDQGWVGSSDLLLPRPVCVFGGRGASQWSRQPPRSSWQPLVVSSVHLTNSTRHRSHTRDRQPAH